MWRMAGKGDGEILEKWRETLLTLTTFGGNCEMLHNGKG
jgi:hypothetical protein